MKAILFSLGSRGDMEPFMALGVLLREKKWKIAMVFPEQFREMVENEGFVFHGLSKDFLDILLNSYDARLIMGGEGSFFKRMKSVFVIARASKKVNQEINDQQMEILLNENPDYVLYHQKCMLPVIWGMKNPGKSIMVSPLPCLLHPTGEHSVIGLKGGGDYGAMINKFSYKITNLIRSIATHKTTKRFYKRLDVSGVGPLKIKNQILNKEKTLYTISSTLFSRPIEWPDVAKVVGFYDRSKIKNWKPEAELEEFIEKYDKIVFISFGSISNPNPEEKTKAILDVLKEHKIPAIINTSWGGLIKPDKHPDHVLFVNNVPYDWIFPKMHAVIHHGGSGTTHSAIKYGCPAMIIPHFIDQFYWNDRVSSLGLGPKGESIRDLNRQNFEKGILDLINNESYKIRAKEVSIQMNEEIQPEDVLRFILS